MGIRDNALSERLQLDSNLTLEKVKKTVRQREAVHDHSQQLNPSKHEPMTVDTVKKVNKPVVRPGGQSNFAYNSGRGSGDKQSCKRCGKNHGHADKCPAKKATCYRCNRKGHFSSQCLSKQASATSELIAGPFLGTLSTQVGLFPSN